MGDCLRNGSVKCRFPNLRVVEAGPVSSSREKKTGETTPIFRSFFGTICGGWMVSENVLGDKSATLNRVFQVIQSDLLIP